MTDTLEVLRAELTKPMMGNLPLIAGERVLELLQVLEAAEGKLEIYREWHLENRRQVNALRDALGRLLAVCRVANTSRSLARIAESYGYDAELEMDDARCVLEETKS